ncbi:nitroreductase [Oceanicoccus sagamiensis]|uniref:Nitroreductase n=1 Tax=Oceanicoccus sagamiensis TaxID=716816 RepID=A0A1X9NJH3_9GAMM|nr:nitroreductase [Oceanicoccus sagamiensis]ARN75995.1 nitroreductase [Oceanicoccus sagamiensis]
MSVSQTVSQQQVFSDIVSQRRSVRGFLPEPVPQALLNTVFELAQKAPSNCNTQPWQVYILSGEKRHQLASRLTESMDRGTINMDFEYEGKYQGVYRERQFDSAMQLYGAMGIERDDKAGRHQAFLDNFNFFGAPHVAFLFLPEPFGLREAADIGLYAQNLMLALTAHGLASCPQTALSFDANTVREVAGIEANNKLLFGISFGYEDKDYPANQCRVGRAGLDESVHFLE